MLFLVKILEVFVFIIIYYSICVYLTWFFHWKNIKKLFNEEFWSKKFIYIFDSILDLSLRKLSILVVIIIRDGLYDNHFKTSKKEEDELNYSWKGTDGKIYYSYKGTISNKNHSRFFDDKTITAVLFVGGIILNMWWNREIIYTFCEIFSYSNSECEDLYTIFGEGKTGSW